ncbi:MAG: branched-chain amino acid ABC transporter permease [Anaerolineales bacterium]|jgi:branched-chain amino acid transport system permease protein|nr:branched-chain amino acid ABC transporter permease [Anaerolineales bacterium]
MRRLLNATLLIEILRPLGQIAVFVTGAGMILSALMLGLAVLLRGSTVDATTISNYGVDLFTYTLVNLPQVLIDGVTIGFVYAAIALGYTMVYGVLEFINFAHSEIFAIGAFVGVEILIALNNSGNLNDISYAMAYFWLLLAVIAAMIAAGATAVAMERIAYRPLRGAPRLVPLISAIGVSFFLQDAIRLIESLTTGQFHRIIPTFGNFDQQISLASLNIIGTKIDLIIQVKSVIVIVSAIFMVVGLNYLVNATKLGKAIRSVAQDRVTANLMGINVNRIIAMTFLIGGTLGGAAGVLFALKFTRIDPFVGFFPGLKAFTAAVLGGIGNITGALLGGLVLGMLETFSGSYLSVFTMGAFGAEYKDILAFAILILVLIFRPSGLLGEQVGQKA